MVERSALVISPSDGGRESLDICIFTEEGVQCLWQQVENASWGETLRAAGDAVFELFKRGLLRHCIAYVECSQEARALCDYLNRQGCATYADAKGNPWVFLTPALVQSFVPGYDHWVRGWAHAMAVHPL
jgi:hypothetical protein